MRVRKTVRKIGSALGIWFSKEESKTHNIDLGDILEITFVKVSKGGKKK